jgi:Fe-S cluster assembly protein SufD
MSALPSPALRSFEEQWKTRTPDGLEPWREAAMRRFVALGLPTVHDESWRYTNLRALDSQPFALASSPPAMPAEHRGWDVRWLTDSDRIPVLQILDGKPDLPARSTSFPGIEVHSLQALAATHPALLARHFRDSGDDDLQRWDLLNTALFSDGLYLKINRESDARLVLVHASSGKGPTPASYPRVIIEAAPGSRATLIEHYTDVDSAAALCNARTQVELAAGANLDHYRVFAGAHSTTHFNSLEIVQNKDSSCRQFTVIIGGSLVRAGMNAHLREPGASLETYSLLVGNGARHIDCASVVTHEAPATRSSQTARSIAGGTSRAIFNSKVIVAAGASRSESKQSCRGMLLSPSAEIDSRPQLEIHTDEVKCAHGATTGRLDAEMYFYLLSRGLDRETAQSLLVFAFVADVLTGMSLSSIRQNIEKALITLLPNEALLKAFR